MTKKDKKLLQEIYQILTGAVDECGGYAQERVMDAYALMYKRLEVKKRKVTKKSIQQFELSSACDLFYKENIEKNLEFFEMVELFYNQNNIKLKHMGVSAIKLVECLSKSEERYYSNKK